ncbi:hypothetical protein XELAEV_18007863mg [Xenopus laevis]|uniref:Uncharacterized protein n=1 Tax=Xenopus laevis TaxID=8355 RepID=A0A974E384_XENLA|nr:hypothetical protein XELAEV_18007863mg [Xenopus laevis]
MISPYCIQDRMFSSNACLFKDRMQSTCFSFKKNEGHFLPLPWHEDIIDNPIWCSPRWDSLTNLVNIFPCTLATKGCVFGFFSPCMGN